MRLDDFQQALYDCIEQGTMSMGDFKGIEDSVEKAQNRDLRFSAIDLLGTLGCTDDKLSKMLMLEKCKFIPLMAKLLNQLKDDVSLRILITRAINNFIISNTQMLLSEHTLLE